MLTHKIEKVIPFLVPHNKYGRHQRHEFFPTSKINNQEELNSFLAKKEQFKVGTIVKYVTTELQKDEPWNLSIILHIENDFTKTKFLGEEHGWPKCYLISNFIWDIPKDEPHWVRRESLNDMEVVPWEIAKGHINAGLQDNLKRWAGRVGHTLPETVFT